MAACFICLTSPFLVRKWISKILLSFLSIPGTSFGSTANSFTDLSNPATGIVTLTGVELSLSEKVT